MNTNTELEATQMTLEDIKASLRQVEPKTSVNRAWGSSRLASTGYE
jgi:hypothetical protein